MPVASRGAVRPLDEIEKEYILAALELNGGNQTHTASQLHIGSATLYRKLKATLDRRKAPARRTSTTQPRVNLRTCSRSQSSG